MVSDAAAGRPYSLAILSGKGGVGKTTLSLNLARRLSQEVPVWLIDLDLFNRGTTSAIWESEQSIPISVAELVRATVDLAAPNDSLDPAEAPWAAVLQERLAARSAELAYTAALRVLPAARAAEGREASYLLWKGLEGVSAERFLDALLAALSALTPGCAVVMDGHGGLDELSIGAALVSDVTYIVNEPDLITFTGSITLYQEIVSSARERGAEPRIEFLVNRVPPGETVAAMERDFGDVLRTISAAREPVAAYFPLERELFGIFGDDPFVSEVFTRYWFSAKVQLLARKLLRFGREMGRLPAKLTLSKGTGDASAARQDASIRVALRREIYKRGDLLLIGWLAYLVVLLAAALWFALNRALSDQTLFGLTSAGAIAASLALLACGLWLAVLTLRWVGVQREHIRNARAVRAFRGRRRRLGDSEVAPLRERLETKAERRGVLRGLKRAGWALLAISLVAALAIPNFLDATKKARQKRTVADIRNTGTAMFSWLTDQVGAAAAGAIQTSVRPEDFAPIGGAGLDQILVPQYMQNIPKEDGWKHAYRFWLETKDFTKKNTMAIYSGGQDGSPPATAYDVTGFDPTDYDQDILWADGFFVRWPQRQ